MKNLAIAGGTPLRTAPFTLRRTMGAEEKQAVNDVMDSDQLSSFFGSPGDQWLGGPKVKEFERKWADKYGFKHAISVNSWTTGLMTAVGAMGIGPGDEVIVSPYTMSASATAILFYGGIPVFADVDPDTYNLTAETIAARITPRTKAIMLVHIFGQACDMDPIMALARQHDLKVIEDGAQSPGVLYKGKPVGAIGDVGGFSLNYHKHIHTGEGGMLVTNDDDVALRCQLIRNHAENLVEAHGVQDLTNMLGSNYRLTELQAAIGIVQLDRLDAYLEQRRKLARHLEQALAGIEGIQTARVADGAEHAYYVYPIKYDATVTGIPRALFVRAVNAELPTPGHPEQVGLSPAYVRPLYLAQLYQKKIAIGGKGFPWTVNPDVRYDYSKGSCPVVEKLHEEQMLLTMLVREPLTEADIDDFAAAIRKVLRHKDELPAG
ncbi:DegT/DnrJ/EryC1/StrS aminotransferase family protein [Massilia sp. YMA4]|uniref:DegT/DnrJ/EryC1/StrS family aminotransferase n=1 Tax=Massilia sp. YMA4 TaxID=1593482 RepID=UPI000DD16D6E|nr:DegT/DnrJ/EryC1/StrS family aminotransferase [Massilia sp. YMA4]AXA93490.1 DegT/DnrJ/EryC1/StrS family aminotransferase [Massilia sp. YMA4]